MKNIEWYLLYTLTISTLHKAGKKLKFCFDKSPKYYVGCIEIPNCFVVKSVQSERQIGNTILIPNSQMNFARLFIHLILVQNKVHQTTFFFAKKICDI